MNEPAVDIADILAGVSSLALATGTDLFVNEEPDKPDNCVTVYDTGQEAEQLYVDPDETALESLSVQVRVRHKVASLAWALANNIKTELHGQNKVTQGGAIYLGIWHASGPFPLGKDGQNRTLYTVNFDMMREPVV